MRIIHDLRWGLAFTVLPLIVSCGSGMKGNPGTRWIAEPVAIVSGFHVPESAIYDSKSGVVYVSNIEAAEGEYWTDDGMGHISVVGVDHAMLMPRWIESAPQAVLNGPKGLCLLGGYLYFTDNTRVMRQATDGGAVEVFASGLGRANDLATDGKNVWVSDTEAGKVYRLESDGTRQAIKAPEAVNGITFSGRKMFAVSFGLHEIYELDPKGDHPPIPFGLADHFTNLDGIEVLEDGSFLVSDFYGNKVSVVSPDRKSVRTLIELETPADIGRNRKAGLLYVPQFMADQLAIYRLKRE